jgi:hypothetical protein
MESRTSQKAKRKRQKAKVQKNAERVMDILTVASKRRTLTDICPFYWALALYPQYSVDRSSTFQLLQPLLPFDFCVFPFALLLRYQQCAQG